ncbi:MAG: pyridoxamine 5'-phosphate oxidase family protein [Lachnospiraceae bacterium]|nr:pyridoxamine 5'-phosphate oxidase family protein [Lachnospiraceae bacterium]
MAIISDEIKELIQEKGTVKALATISKSGEVNVTFKDHVEVDSDGNIVIYELLDSSQSSKNLVYSLWFNKKVALSITSKDGIRYQVKGIPERDIVTGPAYEEKYSEFILENPENDLAGIWVIRPTEVREETYEVRLREEREKYPVIGHLDKDLAP